MNKANKSINLRTTVAYLSIAVSGLVILISPSTAYALSLTDTVDSLPIVGNQQEVTSESTPSSQEVGPETPPTSSLLSPIKEVIQPVVNTLLPEPSKSATQQQQQQQQQPISLPLPLPLPAPIQTLPVINNPVITTPTTTPNTQQPTDQAASTKTPVSSTPTTYSSPEPSNAPVATPTVKAATVTIDPQSPPSKVMLAQAMRGDFMSKYMSEKISDTERNELYALSAGTVLVGAALYLYSFSSAKRRSLLHKSRIPVTVNN